MYCGKTVFFEMNFINNTKYIYILIFLHRPTYLFSIYSIRPAYIFYLLAYV